MNFMKTDLAFLECTLWIKMIIIVIHNEQLLLLDLLIDFFKYNETLLVFILYFVIFIYGLATE